MSLDRRIEIDRLLMQALELEDDARPAFLATIDDASLRADVEEMLALCASDTDPLALDAAAAARLIDAAVEQGSPALSASLGLEDSALPEQIGGWRILERIGQGGMGEVLKVERIDAGFEQLGAMKLIRSGFAIGEFARRFLQERQILARLNHPGIASLLDGGRDAQGHPYLVMEYVDGAPIDQYCDSQRLGVEARIELFIEVCRAVAHAHRSLVIHRDLKPSNILVRADGRVKLLDFGIAKVLGDGEGGDPLATRIEQRMFTPDYASPEQVRGQPVTTASDVYQLGLLLYELLCGHRAQRVGHTGPASIERIVCEQDPTRPSQRIGSGDTELALRRHLQPRQLRRRLRGDLDTIVGKALQKLPERRYGTVDELIDDLIRSRQGRTLHARPDTWRYRMGRFVRRHPVGLAFAVLTLALLSIYLVTLNLQAQALERERDRAQAEAAKARQVQSLVQRLFEGIDPDVSGGEPLSVQALLDRSFGQIEGELGAHPEVRAELLLTVGDVYAALGNYARASELLTQAFGLVEALEAEQPLLAAKVYRSRGRLLGQGNELDEPEALLRRALGLFRSAESGAAHEVAETLFRLAELLMRKARREEALAASREALALRRARADTPPLDLARSLLQTVMLEQRLGRNPNASIMLQESLDLQHRVLPPQHPLIGETQASLALALQGEGQLERALPLHEAAIRNLEAALGSEHPSLGIALGNFGTLLSQLGRPEDAEKIHRRALQIHLSNFGPVHARVALSQNSIGRSQLAQDRWTEAVESFRAALASAPDTHRVNWSPTFGSNLATAYLELGNARAALDVLEQVEVDLPESPLSRAKFKVLQARAWIAADDPIQAERYAREAIESFEQVPDLATEHADAHAWLAEALVLRGDLANARLELELSRELHRSLPDPDPAELARIEARLAELRNPRPR
ncbi:serine/threonine-protein kinase [Aquimonas voraii]|uniref:Serine/threonine protein kinase n=1 Tax=Aquimonas voraii TaxID=265719 RepID=A0A1G6T7J8_9GAMM|nr:serine/threonine-protein kinase [Aquimonas voraii]SDD25009.1 serine/threonine protein kinase [Aquimonas voraii]